MCNWMNRGLTNGLLYFHLGHFDEIDYSCSREDVDLSKCMYPIKLHHVRNIFSLRGCLSVEI